MEKDTPSLTGPDNESIEAKVHAFVTYVEDRPGVFYAEVLTQLKLTQDEGDVILDLLKDRYVRTYGDGPELQLYSADATMELAQKLSAASAQKPTRLDMDGMMKRIVEYVELHGGKLKEDAIFFEDLSLDETKLRQQALVRLAGDKVLRPLKENGAIIYYTDARFRKTYDPEVIKEKIVEEVERYAMKKRFSSLSGMTDKKLQETLKLPLSVINIYVGELAEDNRLVSALTKERVMVITLPHEERTTLSKKPLTTQRKERFEGRIPLDQVTKLSAFNRTYGVNPYELIQATIPQYRAVIEGREETIPPALGKIADRIHEQTPFERRVSNTAPTKSKKGKDQLDVLFKNVIAEMQDIKIEPTRTERIVIDEMDGEDKEWIGKEISPSIPTENLTRVVGAAINFVHYLELYRYDKSNVLPDAMKTK